MAVYENNCGDFSINVSEPHPMWVTIRCRCYTLNMIRSDDLPDLKYLIDQALTAIAAMEAK